MMPRKIVIARTMETAVTVLRVVAIHPGEWTASTWAGIQSGEYDHIVLAGMSEACAEEPRGLEVLARLGRCLSDQGRITRL